MRSRDLFVLAVIVLVGGAVVALLSAPFGGNSGGMMGGMMGGTMGGIALSSAFFILAVVLIVLALVGSPADRPPPAAVAPVFPIPPAPPTTPPQPVAVTSDVEAAVVRLLDEDERLLYLRLRDAGGPVLQKDIVAWRTFSAAKVTRLLDRLEGKGLLVRERSGMTNRIRLTRQPPISGK